ncbi:hypothetical protein [Glutamicibacter ardleyensis]
MFNREKFGSVAHRPSDQNRRNNAYRILLAMHLFLGDAVPRFTDHPGDG